MPEGYEKMVEKFMRQGMSKDEAQKKAARIWNSQYPSRPVTATSHGEKKDD